MKASQAPTPTGAEMEALLRKYDRPGPRYTSYPTAPAWTEDFGPQDMDQRLEGLSRDRDRPLSLYAHIPFCHHRCLYCGCNVVIAPNDTVSAPYMDILDREIDMFAERLADRRRVNQLHLGGGTPTYLQPGQLERLMEKIEQRFLLDGEAELSVEVDPVVTTEEHVRTLRRLGFNRISMGVQDLDPKVQESVERVQPIELTERFYRWCRDAGFFSINMDLIYGLPYQTEETFARTVDQVLRWGPDRVAVFNYAHVPWIKPHQRRMPQEALPPPDTKFAIFVDTSRRFREAGYVSIGLDHFARPADELAVARQDENLRRNFMGYTTKPESDILAFGVSSISEVQGAYAQNQPRLFQYQRDIEAGHLAVCRGVRLTQDDLLRRDVIMGLMCNFALDKADIEVRHGIEFDAYFAREEAALAEPEADGLVRRAPGRIELTPLGQILVRNVAMLFDAHLKGPGPGSDKPLYSRTV